jgi:hypothetical protein
MVPACIESKRRRVYHKSRDDRDAAQQCDGHVGAGRKALIKALGLTQQVAAARSRASAGRGASGKTHQVEASCVSFDALTHLIPSWAWHDRATVACSGPPSGF